VSKSETQNLIVQKWTYERGNYQIIAENAWGLNPFYTQERITVNGVRIRDVNPAPAVLLFWRTMFKDTVLEPGGELDLIVQWKSSFKTVKARLLIDGEKVAWTDYHHLEWPGPRGEWPDAFENFINLDHPLDCARRGLLSLRRWLI